VRSLIKLIVAVLLMVLGAAFAIVNEQPVELDLYFVAVSMPLSMILLLAMGVGILLGSLVSFLYFMKIRKENAELRRQARLAEQEVKNLRSLPISDR
jgi:putative membrane protein